MLLRALKDKGLCKSQCRCPIMTGTVRVQSEAVSPDHPCQQSGLGAACGGHSCGAVSVCRPCPHCVLVH